jgi:hypothetical protein
MSSTGLSRSDDLRQTPNRARLQGAASPGARSLACSSKMGLSTSSMCGVPISRSKALSRQIATMRCGRAAFFKLDERCNNWIANDVLQTTAGLKTRDRKHSVKSRSQS